MKRPLLIFMIAFPLFFNGLSQKATAQELGASFSYFLPDNGSFSVPVAPLSLRGLGVKFGSYIALTTGVSLYRIAGMGIKNVPFWTDKPLMGPFFSVMVPLQLVINIPMKNQKLKFRGGVFKYFDFGTHLNYGNIDRALVNYTKWSVVNANFSYDNKSGFGYMFGAEYIYYIKKGLGIDIGANELIGDSPLNIKGSYTGVPDATSTLQTVQVNYSNSKLDFSGLELSVGVLFSSK